MPLLGPNSDDIRKLHAEVNQLVNQRFLLTTLAITVFGVIAALLVPKTTPQSGTDVGGFIFMMSTLLSILMFVLFLLSHLYKGMIRVYSTYLKITGSSSWESDWSQYRQSPYLGYTKPQALVFLILNGMATIFPGLFAIVFHLRYGPQSGWITALAVGVLVEIAVFAMGLGGRLDRERRAEQQWLAIKAK